MDRSKGYSLKLLVLGGAILTFVGVFAGARRMDMGLQWLFTALYGLMFVLQGAVLYAMRREVFARRLGTDPLMRPWERTLVPAMVLCLPATAVLSSADVFSAGWTRLPGWSLFGGIVLGLIGFLMASRSLMAQPPHAEAKYGESKTEGRDAGPYDTLRYPLVAALELITLSIPLFIGSGVGFIPAAVQLVFSIIYINLEDNWRFNEFPWYDEYLKQTPYRLLPFIW